MTFRKMMTMTGVAFAVAATGGADLARAGIDAGGISIVTKGSVSAFGGIHVNGVRFNTDDTVFVIDGRLGQESDLHVGQVVTVLGTVDTGGATGNAQVVAYRDAVEGSIDAIDADAGRFTVVGQTVLVTAETNLVLGSGREDLSALLSGEAVEVSGFADAAGRIHATFIGLSASDGGAARLTGTVTSSEPAAATITINGLAIDYSSAGQYGLSDGPPAIGERLEVSGILDAETGELIAERVAPPLDGIDAGGFTSCGGIDGIDAGGFTLVPVDGIDAGGFTLVPVDGIDAGGFTLVPVDGIDAGGITCSGTDGIDAGGYALVPVDGIDAGGFTLAAVEGYVGEFTGPVEFTVDGAAVRVGNETRFVNGNASSLGDDRKVDIRGRLAADGVLVADHVEFEPASTAHRCGQVEAVVDGRIIVAGTELTVTAETSYSDLSSIALRRFTAADLYTGDTIEAQGYVGAEDEFVVTRLVRRDGTAPARFDHDHDLDAHGVQAHDE